MLDADVTQSEPTDANSPTLTAGYAAGLVVGPSGRPDRYELFGPPMRGGEGVTWRAQYIGTLNRPVAVAVKVLHRPGGADSSWPPDALLDAWRDRVELLRSAAIPGLVRLYDVEAGPEPHPPGLAGTRTTVLIQMEWVEGITLAEEISGTSLSFETLRRRIGWVTQLATTVSGLQGLDSSAQHRDITPSNCMITPDARLVLIDLSTMHLPSDRVDLLGRHTPAYSAPEVLKAPGALRESSADRWAVGAIAYFCLTGSPPPRGEHERRSALESALGQSRSSLDIADHLLSLLGDDPAQRPIDLVEWARVLGESVGVHLDAHEPPRDGPDGATTGRRLLVTALAAVGAALLAIVAVSVPMTVATLGGPTAAWVSSAATAAVGITLVLVAGRRAPVRGSAFAAAPLAAACFVAALWFSNGSRGLPSVADAAGAALLSVGLAAVSARTRRTSAALLLLVALVVAGAVATVLLHAW